MAHHIAPILWQQAQNLAIALSCHWQLLTPARCLAARNWLIAAGVLAGLATIKPLNAQTPDQVNYYLPPEFEGLTDLAKRQLKIDVGNLAAQNNFNPISAANLKTLNLQKQLSQIWQRTNQDAAQRPKSPDTIAAQAFAYKCPQGILSGHMLFSVASSQLLGLQTAFLQTDQLITNAQNHRQIAQTLSTQFSQMLQTPQLQLAQAHKSQRNDAVLLEIQSMRRFSGKLLSERCFEILVVKSLLNRTAVKIAGLRANEYLASLQNAYYPDSTRLERATRNIRFEWGNIQAAVTAEELNRRRFRYFLGESIHASSTASTQAQFASFKKATWQTAPYELEIDAGQQTAQLNLYERIVQFVDKQKQALNFNDLPKVVAQDRAWVYVDKGRGWGLEMSDRLIVQGRPEIKGHVVRFFTQKTKVPRGLERWPEDLYEGAIIYLRSGDQDIKIGDQLHFDPEVF